MAAKTHKDLLVWQKSVALASSVYAATRLLPIEERFGLHQQLRRAAVAIATNIAEGSARSTAAEHLQFLHLARGSLAELETQTLIAIEQGYLSRESTVALQISELGRLLAGSIRTIASAKQQAHARACSPQLSR